MSSLALEDPLLSDQDFQQILGAMICYGILNNFNNFLSLVNEKTPNEELEMLYNSHQISLFYKFCDKFIKKSPLPELRHTGFLSTLHDGIVGFLKSEMIRDDWMHKVEKYKLVAGLRWLLTRAIVYDRKFSVSDIERTVSSYFPVLPIKPSNSHQWEKWGKILKSDLVDPPGSEPDLVKFMSDFNHKAKKYFTAKIDNIATERKNIDIAKQDESIMTIWSTIIDFFKTFVEQLGMILPQNALKILFEDPDDKMILLNQKINSNNPSEDDLICFFNYLKNSLIESKFWMSTVCP